MATKKYSEIDITKFVYQQPKRNPQGGMNLYIDESSASKRSPVFQLEPCIAKFGTQPPPEGSQSTRRNMEISVTSEDMINFIKSLDEQNIREVAKKSELFFKKELSEEVLAQTLYRWSCAVSEKYDPLLRVKIATQGKYPTKVFRVTNETEGGNLETEQGTWEDITPWSKVVCIVQLSGLWFVSKSFGQTILAQAVLVWPNEEKQQSTFAGYNLVPKSTPIVEQPTLTVNEDTTMDTDEIM